MIINSRATHRLPRKHRIRGNRSRSYTPTAAWVPSDLDDYVKGRVPVPPSSPQFLVFLYDHLKGRFDTSCYNLIEDNNRITLEEISQFLKEVSVPITKFERIHGSLVRMTRGYNIFLAICFILLPIGIFLLIIASRIEKSAPEKFFKAREKAKEIVLSKRQPFTERGLEWTTTTKFPLWIGLQINNAPLKPEISSQQKSGDVTQPGSADSGAVKQEIQIITTLPKSDQKINTAVSAV